MDELRPFLNERRQLTSLPAKHSKKLLALYYLSEKLEQGKMYTESEINDVLNEWHTFFDPATLRRELYNKHLLDRSSDGSRYWAEMCRPTLEDFLQKYVQK